MLDMVLGMDTAELFQCRCRGIPPFQRGKGRGAQGIEHGGQARRAFGVTKAGVVFQTNRVGE